MVEGRTVPLFDISLGTGPESTGYENILLRGMYLGLSRAEIRAKVKENADFAGLARSCKAEPDDTLSNMC